MRFEVLESNVPLNVMDKMECLYIRFFNSVSPNGYNLTHGGNGKRGYITPDETKKRISNTLKGHTVTVETRKKIGETSKGNTYHKGFKHSVEIRKKISDAAQGRIPWNKGKKLIKKSSPGQFNLF